MFTKLPKDLRRTTLIYLGLCGLLAWCFLLSNIINIKTIQAISSVFLGLMVLLLLPVATLIFLASWLSYALSFIIAKKYQTYSKAVCLLWLVYVVISFIGLLWFSIESQKTIQLFALQMLVIIMVITVLWWLVFQLSMMTVIGLQKIYYQANKQIINLDVLWLIYWLIFLGLTVLFRYLIEYGNLFQWIWFFN